MANEAASLTNIKFFELLNSEDRQALASIVDYRKLGAGEVLFHTGDPGESVFLMLSGALELYVKDTTGQKIVLTTVERGALFGELSLLDEGPRTATAVAVTASELAALHRRDLLALLQRSPDAALHMLAAVASMTRKADELLRTRVTRNVNEEEEVRLTALQKVAGVVTRFSGSLYFLALNLLWLSAYMALNAVVAGAAPFDPYPFGFLKLLVSLEALFLSVFVLINQSRQAEKDRMRANIEYEVNVKAELGITHLHEKVDRIYENMLDRFVRLEKGVAR